MAQWLPAAVNSTSFLYAKWQILLPQVQKALDGEELVGFCCTGGVRFLDHAQVIQISWVLQNTAYSALPWKKLAVNGRRPWASLMKCDYMDWLAKSLTPGRASPLRLQIWSSSTGTPWPGSRRTTYTCRSPWDQPSYSGHALGTQESVISSISVYLCYFYYPLNFIKWPLSFIKLWIYIYYKKECIYFNIYEFHVIISQVVSNWLQRICEITSQILT